MLAHLAGAGTADEAPRPAPGIAVAAAAAFTITTTRIPCLPEARGVALAAWRPSSPRCGVIVRVPCKSDSVVHSCRILLRIRRIYSGRVRGLARRLGALLSQPASSHMTMLRGSRAAYVLGVLKS